MNPKLTILVADDEELERKAIVELIHLSYAPVQVMEAANGRQAVELAASSPVNIAFMDIDMPVMNGLEALQEIFITQSKLFAVMLTAYDEFEYAVQALKLGVADYILKPARRKNIASCIQAYVERNGSTTFSSIEKNKSVESLFPYLEDNLLLSIAMGNTEDMRQLLQYFFPSARWYRLAVTAGEEGLIRNELDAVRRGLEQAGYQTVVGTLGKKSMAVWAGQREAFSSGKTPFAPLGWRISPPLEDWKRLNIQYRMLCDDEELPAAPAERANDGCEKQLAWQMAAADQEGALQTLSVAMDAMEGEDLAAQRKRMLSLCIITDHYLEKLLPDDRCGEIPDFSLLQTKEALYHAMQFFIKSRMCGGQQEQQPRLRKLVRDIMDDIEAHYADGLYSLNAAAQNLNLSPGYLSKLFKTRMGVTFTEYLSEVRIDEAKRLLRHTDRDVSDISACCGFNSVNYFCKIFKKIVGVPASDYREKH